MQARRKTECSSLDQASIVLPLWDAGSEDAVSRAGGIGMDFGAINGVAPALSVIGHAESAIY